MNSYKTLLKLPFFSLHSNSFFMKANVLYYWSPLSVNNAFYLSSSFNLYLSLPSSPLTCGVVKKTMLMLI